MSLEPKLPLWRHCGNSLLWITILQVENRKAYIRIFHRSFEVNTCNCSKGFYNLRHNSSGQHDILNPTRIFYFCNPPHGPPPPDTMLLLLWSYTRVHISCQSIIGLINVLFKTRAAVFYRADIKRESAARVFTFYIWYSTDYIIVNITRSTKWSQ
jgi:hypothetical protein